LAVSIFFPKNDLRYIQQVPFLRSHSLNHRQFKKFLHDIEAKFFDIPYHSKIRWLSCGNVLSLFFELKTEIQKFLIVKKRPERLLSNNNWLCKLAFLADLMDHINQLNLKLQKENNLISDLYTLIKAFRRKLTLFESKLIKTILLTFID
jgi:hypothetical protein